MQNLIPNFSKHLFWDVDSTHINQDKNDKYIIKKVLQYGLFKDWQLLQTFYGIDKITEIAVKIRDLDKKTIAFLSLISNTPKHKFVCYTTKQSTPKHWNF